MENGNEQVLLQTLLPEWYPGGIFVIPEQGQEKQKDVAEKKADKRRYLVLSSEAVSGTLLTLLTGIINACRINMPDVHVIHYNGSQDYKQLLENYGPSYIMMFGVEPSQIDLPIVFPHFQMQRFSDAAWVSSPELGLIANDKSMKTKLWHCLKQVYGV